VGNKSNGKNTRQIKVDPSRAASKVDGRINSSLVLSFGLDVASDVNEALFLVLKYLDNSKECFSKWSKTDLKKFAQASEKLRSMTWQQMREQGGSVGNKTGFAYTQHKGKSTLGKSTYVKLGLSEDIDGLSEIRVGKTARVHGFK
jgi:hypothetical protein